MKKIIIVLFLLLFVFHCTEERHVEKEDVQETLKGGVVVKALLIIAQDQFRDEEALEPIKVFKDEGYSVTIASTSKDKAKGMLGAELEPDMVISEVNPDDFDILSITGGMGSPDYLWNNEDLYKIINSFNEKGKVFGAICLSPVVLAKTGILNGKTATCYVTDEVKKEFEKANVTLSEEDVFVTDSRIITGNGPNAATDYAKKIVEIYKSKQ